MHLKVAPFAFNIAIFFKEQAIVNKSWDLLQTCSPNLNPISLKNQSWQSSHSFDELVLFISIPSETSLFWYRRIFIIDKVHHLKIIEGKIYHLF